MQSRFMIRSAFFVSALLVCAIPSFSQPALSTPTNGAINQPLAVTLSWNSLGGATNYRLQIALSSDFLAPLTDQNGGTTWQLITNLSKGTTYYWRVDATVGSETAWSSTWSFATIPVTPGIPTLSSPTSGATGETVPANLSWAAVSGATSYALQVSSVSTFSNFAFNQSGISAASQLVSGLLGTATYYWRANASNAGGTSTWSAVWNFTTTVVGPGNAPTLSSPSNNAVNQSISPTLSWSSVSGAAYYVIHVTSDADFGSISLLDHTVTSPTYAAAGLSNNTVYRWAVKAGNSAGESPWSSIWTFTTIPLPPAAPILSLPLNSTPGLGTTVTVSWNTSATAATYTVQVSITSSFASTVTNKTGVATLSSAVAGLSLNNTYYWRVNATNISGPSAWSDLWSFSTVNALPGTPTLISPANSASFSTLSPILNWGLVIGATSYGLQVSKANDFSTTVINQTALATNTISVDLQPSGGGIYYWRVRATNAGGSSTWSGGWLFSVPVVSVIPNEGKSATSFVHLENEVLSYGIAQPQAVKIFLYTISGRQITLLNQSKAAGSYRVSLKGFRLPAGRYIVRFKAGNLDKHMAVFLSSR